VRGLTQFLAAMLPLDAGSRRALDETFADWRHEEALATSPSAGVRAVIGGLWGAAVVVARSAMVDLGRSSTYRIGLGTIGVSLLLSAVIVMRFLWLPWERVSIAESAVLFLYLLPMGLPVALPLAALAPPFSRRSASSLMGLAVALTLFSVTTLGWISPKTNQAFRESVAATFVARGDSVVPGRGLAELSASELVTLARSQPDDGRIFHVLNTRAAYVVAVPMCLLLGAQARRVASARDWRSGGRLIAWAVALGSWGCAFAGSMIVYRTVGPSADAASRAWVMWSIPASLALSAIILAWLASREEQRPDSSMASAG
jgi:hypothetical protein